MARGTWKVVEWPRREELPDPSNVKEGQKANGGRGKWQCDVRKNTPCNVFVRIEIISLGCNRVGRFQGYEVKKLSNTIFQSPVKFGSPKCWSTNMNRIN